MLSNYHVALNKAVQLITEPTDIKLPPKYRESAVALLDPAAYVIIITASQLKHYTAVWEVFFTVYFKVYTLVIMCCNYDDR